MPEKIRLVDRDILDGLDALALFDLQHSIHQENRITVGQELENLVDIDHGVF